MKIVTKKKSLRMINILMILITIFNVISPVMAVNTTDMPQHFEVKYNGKITYGASTVGDFTVAGKQAFCLEHSKTTPSTGVGLTTNIYENDNVKKALYYGWGGPEQWSGFTSRAYGVVATSLALSHYYSGDAVRTVAKDFVNFLNTKSVPSFKVRFSTSNVSAYKEGDIQRTETIELSSGMTSGSVNIDLQDAVTYVDETHNTRQTGENVTIYGQTRFHFEAPINVNLGTWTTGEKSQGFEYQPIVGVTNSASMQNIGYLDMVYDPSQTTSLTVEWAKAGNFKLKKADNKGKAVVGVTFKLAYNSDMTEEIGTYQTGSDGSFMVEDLRAGDIYYQEIATLDKLVLDNSINHAVINAGNTTEINFVNNVKQGSFQIIKKDNKTGKIVRKAGAEFEILQDSNVVSTITTNNQGIASSDMLDYGVYTVREKKAPYKYVISNETKQVDICEDNGKYEIEIYNEATVGKINLSKGDTITGKTPQGEATLEGAVYGLYARNNILDPADDSVIYNANQKIANLITDNNGNATIGNLYLGEYYIKELTPSVGYNLDTTIYNIDLTYENQYTSVVTRNEPVKERVISQGFQIIKISSDENGEAEILSGVEFTIKAQKDIDKYGSWEKAPIAKNANAQETTILRTDEKGYAVSERLPYGTYIVRETKVPDNKYKVPDFKVVITEDSSTPQTWRIFNDTSFRSVLAIIKQDEETGKTVKISNAQFKIKNTETGEYFGYWDWNPLPHYVNSWETTKDGTVMTGEQLPVGKYQLEEIKSPFGYLVSKNPIQFEITSHVAYQTLPDGNTPIITIKQKDKPVKGKVNITKTGEVLVGFENGKFIYEEKGLANAKYEILAKEDILDPSNDGSVIYKKGTVVDTITTNTEGKVTSKALPLGEYSVREIQAPNGFVLNSEIKDISLVYENQETEIVYDNASFKNERQKVDLTVYKKDYDTNDGLLCAEFGIYAKDNIYNYNNEIVIEKGTLIEKVTSNETGKVHFETDLPLAEYEIKEIQAPIGYSSSNQIIKVDATYKGQDIETIENEYEFKNKIITVEISKKDITDDSEIKGAYIKVFEKDNEGAIFEEWISGQDGENEDGTIKPHIMKGLEVGKTYIMREISSPYGFAIAQDIEFTIQDTSEVQKVEMKDEVVFGQLEWNKTGDIFMAVAKGNSEFGETFTPAWHKSNILDTEITIYANEQIKIGNTVYYEKDEKIETLESDWEKVTSKKLPVGKYYYVESKVPFGYIGNTDKHYFEIKDNQKAELQIIESTLNNNRAKVNIDLTKVLEEQQIFKNDKAYKDIRFGIYTREDIYDYMGNVAIENGSLIAVTEINKEGHLINVPDLPIGTYYIKELSTNSQYVLDENSEYDFEIAYHGKDIAEYTIQINNGTIENKLARGTIQVIKKDSFDENKRLENVEFNISANKNMNEIIMTEKTNENGIATFENLELGTYYIQEVGQVEGYVVNDYIYEVKVTTNGDLLIIDVYNKPTEMEFSKVNETGVEELAGATIQIIEKETGKIIEEWVSTEETHIIHYLVEGKEYIMREIISPKGYGIAEEISFIAGDGQKVVMQDMPIPETPKTGDERNTILWVILLGTSTTLLLSISIYEIIKKRRNK